MARAGTMILANRNCLPCIPLLSSVFILHYMYNIMLPQVYIMSYSNQYKNSIFKLKFSSKDAASLLDTLPIPFLDIQPHDGLNIKLKALRVQYIC